MKVVIPMKPGLPPQEMTPRFRNHVYDEFASRYLLAIGVEPTKLNIARMRSFVPMASIELLPKFKVNGCLRDELSIDASEDLGKLRGYTNISGDADLFRKVLHSKVCAFDNILSSEQPNSSSTSDERLPLIHNDVQNRSDITEQWYPTQHQIQRALADFSANHPLGAIKRNLKEEQVHFIEKMLQSEQMVDLVQTLCHFLHYQMFVVPLLHDPAALSSKGESKPTPPLTPRSFDATVWRMDEAFALLLAPYKRAKPLVSVVSVMISFTARGVAKRMLVIEFAAWCRSMDGKEFLDKLDELVMARLDPQGYMSGIDLFGDGRTCTRKREAIGLDQKVKMLPKRKWMRQMYKLSPLMSTLAGSLMTNKAKKAIDPQDDGHKGNALDDYSRTKRVESMAMGMRKSLPYAQRPL